MTTIIDVIIPVPFTSDVIIQQPLTPEEINSFVGMPTGGLVGQVLSKASGTDFDIEWIDVSGVSSPDWVDITNKPLTFTPSAHTHSITEVVGLQTALDNKAPISHSHVISDVSGLQSALDSKASTSHTHVISDVSGLQAALDGKFAIPTGDTTQYIAGDGSLVAFPIDEQAGTLVRQVRNETGTTLTKGSVIYITGASGNKPTVSRAIATTDETSAQTFGVVQADIPNNNNGYVVIRGDVVGLDTSSFTEGTQLYLSGSVAGSYTQTKPVAPVHLVYVGVVTRSHATQGQIEVAIQNGYELDEIHDVLITSVADNQVLVYEQSTDLWKNKTVIQALGYTPYNATNPNGYTSNTGTVTTFSFTNGGGFTGTVTNSGTAPTLSLTLQNASTSQSGQLTSTDWNTFNNKQNALVSGTNIRTVNGNSLLGSGDITISGGSTNLSLANHSATTLDILSDTGTDVTLPQATTSLAGLFSASDKTKLNGIATGATANSSDAVLLSRSNHTGTQLAATISDFNAVADARVVAGITGKENTIAAGTTSQYWRGDKSWQTLDKSAVGLANVDNTSDATKNSASATLTNKTISGASNTITNIAQSSITNLTTDLAGKQPLDGDLTSLAAASATNSLYYRSAADTWSPVTIGANISFTGGTLSATGGGGGGASVGGTANEVQYNDGAGGLGGAANVEIDNGNLKLVSLASDPATPTGGILLYSKGYAGRQLPKMIGPSGIDTALQVGLHGNSVFMVGPASGTTAPTVWGGTLTTAATMSSQQTIASANRWLATYRKRFATSTTAGNTSGMRTAYTQWFLGNAAGFGGFFFRAQFGWNINLNGGQKFIGLCASTVTLSTEPSALTNMLGCGWDSTDASTGNLFFMRNDGTGTATKVDLGTGAARSNTTHGYELMMFAAPNSNVVNVFIQNLHTGTVLLDTTYNTDVPAFNIGMAFKCEVRNGAQAAADNIECAKVYIETDY